MADPNLDHLEVLVFAASPRDAELTVGLLKSVDVDARAIKDSSELIDSLLNAGALIISEESLTPAFLDQLRFKISTQPHWSDLPVIVATSGGGASAEAKRRMEWATEHLQNVTLLERPIRITTLITVIRAVLKSRRKQFELKSVLEELERSRQSAERANQAKSMFLANMSHEIRTPLGAITGFSKLIQDPQATQDDRLRFAEIIARNGEQLSSLIGDILDLSKVESGKVELEKVEIPLADFFNESANWFRPIVERNDLVFVVDQRTSLDLVIRGDRTRIRQVLLNLISNAVKFTKRGSVTLSVGVEEKSRGTAWVRFDVTDTGIGMGESDKARIFKPFSQADESVTRKYGGTGLGLVLSKEFANVMGGDLVLVTSEPGQGSRFAFSFPVELVAAAPVVERKSEIGLLLVNKVVLVAEDSPDNQFLMRRYLETAGAKVVMVDNGELAVEAALKGNYNVVLMDVQMPVMDGLTATRELRNRGYKRPIIALTAHAFREERERSLLAGCDEHLTKPVDREKLLTTIASY